MRTAFTLFLLALSAVATGWLVSRFGYYEERDDPFSDFVALSALLWLLFAAAYLVLRRIPDRHVVVVVAVGSVAIAGAALLGPPNTSTDSARYAWDGIVQNAGESPYAYVPADPALRELRTDWLFPSPALSSAGNLYCPGERTVGGSEPGTDARFCTTINRANVPTIYPPLAEMFFAGVRLLVPTSAEYAPMQVAGFVLSLLTTALLLVVLRRRRLDPRWAALWGWCPLVATEGITNSHVDILAGFLVLVATVLVASGRRLTGGIALGAAIAVKLIPVIAAPALLRRQGWKVIVGAVVTFTLLYVPYVLSTGIGVLGYLPGYLTEEGYDTGRRFILVSLIAPGTAATVVVAAVLAVTAVLVIWKTDPAHPWVGQLVMIGVTLMITTPRYPWYALLLIPFVAMTGRWEWLSVGLVLTLRSLYPVANPTRVGMIIAIVLVIVMSFHRAGPGSVRRVGRWLRHPLRAALPAIAASPREYGLR